MSIVSQGPSLPVPRRQRAKPTIITLDDGRRISSHGLYSCSLVSEWLLGEGDCWVTVAEIARFSKHSASPYTKKYVRRRMRDLVKHFLNDTGLVLLVEYGSTNGGASAVKVYRGKKEEDRQAATAKLEEMRRRKDATETEIRQMSEIITATHLVA